MSSVKPGDVLAGKYRVERVLGSGGMGYVVAARHLQLDQLVAMKFLRQAVNGNDETEATGRFLREAKAVVRLRDEHVAKVFDVGTLDSGEPYIVMEYLDGCDLSALSKKRGQIPVAEAVDYVMQACEALAEAHSLGIVHRDVKLANLFLTRGHAGSPLVKVLDFGVSKMNPFGEADVGHEMTRTSALLGSPRFMSPEQMRDPRAVDARSDLWSLGVVLYRLVSGKPPFEAETLGRLLSMVMHEAPDALASTRHDLPPGFSELVHHCLEKDPNHRFSNVAELAYAMVPYAFDPGRARGVADRIAQTLRVAPMPASFEQLPLSASGSRSSFTGPAPSHSAPVGVSETGTAAPWAGTHGGRRADSNRSGLVWAVLALTATLVAGGLFAKVRADRANAAISARAAAVVAAQQPLSGEPAPVQVPALTATTMAAPAVVATFAAPPAAAAALAPVPATSIESIPSFASPQSVPAARRALPASSVAPHRSPHVASTSTPAAAPAQSSAGSGIPSTRD